MKKYIVVIWLSLVMGLVSCDNYLDVVPKGEAVLNSTDDYLGLIEAASPKFSMTPFGIWQMKLPIIKRQSWNLTCIRCILSGSFGMRVLIVIIIW